MVIVDDSVMSETSKNTVNDLYVVVNCMMSDTLKNVVYLNSNLSRTKHCVHQSELNFKIIEFEAFESHNLISSLKKVNFLGANMF